MYGYEKRYKLIVGSVTDSREYLLYHKFSDNNIKVKGGNYHEHYNAHHSRSVDIVAT
jgi:hypothetical protein